MVEPDAGHQQEQQAPLAQGRDVDAGPGNRGGAVVDDDDAVGGQGQDIVSPSCVHEVQGKGVAGELETGTGGRFEQELLEMIGEISRLRAELPER